MATIEPPTTRSRRRAPAPGYRSEPSVVSAPRELVGVDVLLHWSGRDPHELAELLTEVCSENLHLMSITSRGVEVWPRGSAEGVRTDAWRCRFMDVLRRRPIRPIEVLTVLRRMDETGFEFFRAENLYTFGGRPAVVPSPER